MAVRLTLEQGRQQNVVLWDVVIDATEAALPTTAVGEMTLYDVLTGQQVGGQAWPAVVAWAPTYPRDADDVEDDGTPKPPGAFVGTLAATLGLDESKRYELVVTLTEGADTLTKRVECYVRRVTTTREA